MERHILNEFKHFDLEEFHCKCGKCKSSDNAMSLHFVRMLDLAREEAEVIFAITSGYRCEAHNQAVGGNVNSSHLKGLACDIRCSDSLSRQRILTSLIKAGFQRIGIAENFIHVDIDEDRTVGKFPAIWMYEKTA